MCHEETGYHAQNRWRSAIASFIQNGDHHGLETYAGYMAGDSTSQGNACGDCRRLAPELMAAARKAADIEVEKAFHATFEPEHVQRLFPKDRKWVVLDPVTGKAVA